MYPTFIIIILFNSQLGSNFITVTKQEDEQWKLLKMKIFSVIMDHFASGNNILNPEEAVVVSDTTILPSDSDTVALIKELLESKIRPTVQDDGGDIHYVG